MPPEEMTFPLCNKCLAERRVGPVCFEESLQGDTHTIPYPRLTLRVHVPKNLVLGIWVIVIVVLVLGK